MPRKTSLKKNKDFFPCPGLPSEISFMQKKIETQKTEKKLSASYFFLRTGSQIYQKTLEILDSEFRKKFI